MCKKSVDGKRLPLYVDFDFCKAYDIGSREGVVRFILYVEYMGKGGLYNG